MSALGNVVKGFAAVEMVLVWQLAQSARRSAGHRSSPMDESGAAPRPTNGCDARRSAGEDELGSQYNQG